MITITDGNGPKWESDRFFGRQEELNFLQNLAEEPCSACVLIHGPAGMGKTTLVHSIPWKEHNWLFVSQKYQKQLRAEPYSALIRALVELIDVWEAKHPSKVKKLLNVLYDDFDILHSVVPSIFKIVDKCSVDPRFSAMKQVEDMKIRRLNKISKKEKMGGDSAAVAAALLRLISCLSVSSPIVLFLDDIHYADPVSMDVLELIGMSVAMLGMSSFANNTGDETRFLLVLSCKDYKLEANSNALKAVESIQRLKSTFSLHLKDLDVGAISDLVASLVKADPTDTLELAKVIHKKTAGNPFFVSQFLRYARERGYFKFSQITFKWEWGHVDILDEYSAVSDNVADILAASMDRLSPTTQLFLKVSSCLGKVIPLDVLAEYSRIVHNETKNPMQLPAMDGPKEQRWEKMLEEAVEAGILVKSMTRGAYMFSNGRLLAIVYSLTPPEVRCELHKDLGNLMWKLGAEGNEDWMIFMAANQMNKYAELLQSESCLGNDVAKLNLQAAKLSLQKGAIYPALNLLVNAEKHMKLYERWSHSYDLTLEVMATLAEAKLSVGKVDEAMEVAKLIIDHGKSLDDKFRAYIVLLQALVSGKDRCYDRGVEKTLELLKMYGEEHPKKLYPGQKFVEKAKLKKMIPKGGIEALLELPLATDKKGLQIQTLLVDHLAPYALHGSAYQSLNWFASARALKNTLKYGISPVSNMAVLNMAVHLRKEGHYKEAAEYGEYAIRIGEKIPRKLGSNHGLVRTFACAGVFAAVRSFNYCLNELIASRTDCLRCGLAKQSIMPIMGYCTVYLCVGFPLSSLEQDLIAHTRDAREFGSVYTMQQYLLILHQTVLNLQNTTENDDPTLLHGDAMQQEAELQKVEGHAWKMTLRDINVHRLLLACIFGAWDTAEVMMDALDEYLDMNERFLPRNHFRRCYLGLAGFALGRKSKSGKKRKRYAAVGKKMLKMFEEDMNYGSVNAYPIVTMLEAEESPSKERYDKAIRACARLGQVHHEAYMCERAAEFFEEQDDEGWTQYYTEQAVVLYGEWGATGKVRILKRDCSHALVDKSSRQSGNRSLQGRSRYSPGELEALRTIDWKSVEIELSQELAST